MSSNQVNCETYKIPHSRSAVEEDASVVGPLNVVQLGAIERIIGTVVNKIFITDQADARGPIPHAAGEIGKSGVARVEGQTSA